MRKLIFFLALVCPFISNSQITLRSIAPTDLPNLIPGYSEISAINQQSLFFTYTLPSNPPQPVDGDTTTEGNGLLKYGEVIPVNFSPSNGNYTQTSQGNVWTLGIKVLGGAKNLALTFDSIVLSPNAELYVYNQSQTTLLGAVKAFKIRVISMDAVWMKHTKGMDSV